MRGLQRIVSVALGAAIALAAAAVAAGDAEPNPGVDLAGIDYGIKPGDDFDGYANGAWRKAAVIPSDLPESFSLEVHEKAQKRNAELIRDLGHSNPAPGTDARRIADYYAAFMDEATLEKNGLTPLRPTLAKIAAIKTRADLAQVLGENLRADADPLNATHFNADQLFGLFVAQGLQDPAHNMPYLLQGGLGMPNRDYYLASDTDMAKNRAAYRTYIGALLELAGIAEADDKASEILALETRIAQAEASLLDSEDVHKAGAPQPLATLMQSAPGLDWPTYFKAAGLDRQPRIALWQPEAITRLSALTAGEPLQAWKDYLVYHLLNHYARFLPRAYDELYFGFYGRTLQGTPQQRERWKRAIEATNHDLGDAVGQIYVRRYFPASSKRQVQQMVSALLAAFAEHIDTIGWMTPATRQKAKAKIATLRVGVGYPERWRNYAALIIRSDDPAGNHQRAEIYEYHHQRAKLSQPVDRDEWWVTPQIVTGVNLPLQNALDVSAALLEAPNFDPKADAAANYGSIGAMIGHEIGHSFDNTGAEFDAQGRLDNWWTPQDQAQFKAAGQRLVEQYNAYEPLPGLHLNGQQILGENIADLSGLTAAYVAYRRSLAGKPAPMIDGLTGDQRFFLAFAQSHRSKIRENVLRQRLVIDQHAPERFRAFTVRNIDAWYPAFKVQPDDALYLSPDARVRIW
jgi:putative endopeptidase